PRMRRSPRSRRRRRCRPVRTDPDRPVLTNCAGGGLRTAPGAVATSKGPAGDMPAQTQAAPVVQMRAITVRFPGVLALDNVDFALWAGEVHTLMGENGAGKSTLIKALTGVYQVDAGS